MRKTKQKIVLASDSEDDSDDDNMMKTSANGNTVCSRFISSDSLNSYRKFLNNDHFQKKILENDPPKKIDQVKEKSLANDNDKIADDQSAKIIVNDIRNHTNDGNIPSINDDNQLDQKTRKRHHSPDSLNLPQIKPPTTKDNDNITDQHSSPEIVELSYTSNSPIPIVNSSIIQDDEEINNAINEWIRIRVQRLDRIEYFRMLRTQSFSTIFDQIAERFDVSISRLILYLNDKIVDAKSTPNSINLSFADIFEMIVRSEDQTDETGTAIQSNNDDPNMIELHLRDSSKKRLTCHVNRFENVRYLAEIFAKDRGIPIEKILLKFDSETMDLMQKIDACDLENDDQIDVIIKQ